MAEEVELKLLLPGIASDEIRQRVEKFACGPARREKLVSVYYDTARGKLHRHGLTLRVRRAGPSRIQTIKSEIPENSLARGEWESEIADDEPDLDRAKDTALSPLVTKKLAKKLKPVFETTVSRTRLPLKADGGIVELAIDRGEIRSNGRSAAVAEVEIELKLGCPSVLAKIASALAQDLPAAVSLKSKAERGYELSDGHDAKPVSRSDIHLSAKSTIRDSFKTIAFSCLRHWAMNADAVRAGDPEGVHQMRVGLRRLRAALSLYKDLLDNEETAQLKTELKWLTEQLGPARDLDVYLTETLLPQEERHSDMREIATLDRHVEEERRRGFEVAKHAVESTRFRQLVLRTALWIVAGRWQTETEGTGPSLRKFARKTIAKRTRKLARRIRKVSDLDEKKRHKLRIAAKKLRYAEEFFDDLFPGKKSRRKQHERTLKAVQNALGKVNDITVHKRYTNQLMHTAEGDNGDSAKAFALGYVSAQEETHVPALLSSARKAGKTLAATKPFW